MYWKDNFFSEKQLQIENSGLWKHVMSTYIVTFFSRVIDSNISPNTATKNCPTSLRNNFIHSKWTGFKQFSNTHATKFVFAIVFGLIVRQGLIFKVITLIVNQVVCLINRGSLAGPIKMEPTNIGPCPFTLAYPLIPFCSFCLAFIIYRSIAKGR